MPLLKRISQHWRLKPLAPGATPPALSLTAEEGTWIKLRDFKGHLNIVLVFFRSLRDDSTDDCLRELDKVSDSFEALDTIVFGVTQHRTDELRVYRSRLGLDFHLIYDPMALTARKFGCSGRLRPYCRPSVVVVGKDGQVMASTDSWFETHDLLARLAEAEGCEVPEQADERAFTGVRDPGAPADDIRSVTAAEAEAMLAELDNPYILLDVRTQAEHAAYHPAGARCIPLDELPHRYHELEQNTDIVCISQTGGQSETAAEFLTSVGMSDVFSVMDGMAGWSGAPAD